MNVGCMEGGEKTVAHDGTHWNTEAEEHRLAKAEVLQLLGCLGRPEVDLIQADRRLSGGAGRRESRQIVEPFTMRVSNKHAARSHRPEYRTGSE